MTFERTEDLDLVRAILARPEVWPHIGDDFAPALSTWRPNADPRIWYVLAIAAERPIGVYVFLPDNPICWQVHAAFVPEARGRLAHQAGREIVPWVWEHSDCRRIVASVPQSNRAAVLYGLRAMNLKKFGVNEKSFLKQGRLWDQVLMGVSRPNGE